jgi:signal transduction histidine kinase
VKSTLEDRVLNVLRHLAHGTHLCHFYQTPQDLLDVLVPYFAAGLERGERCLWITDDALSIEEATRSLAKAVPDLDERLANGDIEFFKHTEWYLTDGEFDEGRVLDQFAQKESEALEAGYRGLCVTGNTFWARDGHWSDLLAYEQSVHRCFCNFRMSAVCTYPLARCSAADIIDVTKVHDIVLIRRGGTWDVIENAELRAMREELQESHEQLRKLAHQMINAERRERKRISRVLHDGLQQTIVATQLTLSEARRRNNGIAHAEAIDRAEHLLSEAMRECRTLTTELSPPILHDGCLVQALQWLAQRFKDQYGLTSHLKVPARHLPLDEHESVLLFEIARELLFNVVKHAGVREAYLSLQVTKDQITLEVRDDGMGCDPRELDTADEHFGLLGIRERIGMLLDRFTPEECANYFTNAGYASA